MLLLLTSTILFLLFGLLIMRLLFFPKRRNDISRNIGHGDISRLTTSPVHIYVAFCDYFKPFAGHASQEIAEHRVVTWYKEYSRIAKTHTDSEGRNPVHTFFFPEEDYNPLLIDTLSRMVKDGIADIEISLQNNTDSIQTFRRKLEEFRDVLFHHHGLLRKNSTDKITFGYIRNRLSRHNTLINSNFENELTALIDTGCYADFSNYSNTEIISISHKDCRNQCIAPDSPASPDAANRRWYENQLPFFCNNEIYNWKSRIWGLFPKYERGEISAHFPFHPSRVDLWLRSGIRIANAPDHVFIKLNSCGCMDQSIRYLLGENGLVQMWQHFEERCIGNNFVLHYVSAWDFYLKISELLTKPPLYNFDSLH